MAEVVSSVEIDAAPAAVWAAVTDWERHGKWMLFTTVRRLEQGGEGVGGRIRAVTGFGPLGVPDPMTITVWRPPYRCENRHDGRLVRGVGAFDVEPLPDGRSRFTWSEWLDPPFGAVGKVGFVLVKPFFQALVAVCLWRLARWAPTR
jgi:hypothetical protein